MLPLLLLLQAVLLGPVLLLLCGKKKKDEKPVCRAPKSRSRLKSPQRAATSMSDRQQDMSLKAENSMKKTGGAKSERRATESSQKDPASYSSQTVLVQNMTDAMKRKTFPSVQVPENQRKKTTSRDGSKKPQQVSFALTVAPSKRSLRTKKKPSTPIETSDNSEKSNRE